MRKSLSIIFMFLLVFCSKDSSVREENPSVQIKLEDKATSYTLNISSTSGGSVSSLGGTYDQGSEVSISASASPGYIFTGWSNGNSESNITVILNSDISLVANFEPYDYPLRINRQEFGRLTSNKPLEWEGEFYDYNDDGLPDFVALDGNNQGIIRFLTGVPNEFNQVKTFSEFKTLNIFDYINVSSSDSLNGSDSILIDLDNDNIDEVVTNLQGEWYNAPNFNNGDWNSDGIPNGFFWGPMYIIYEDGSVIEFDSIPSQKFSSLYGIDFNNDGYKDVLDLLPSYIYYDSDINVYLNDGQGGLLQAQPVENIKKNLPNWADMVYEDINNDGFKDFIGGHNTLEINYGTNDPEVFNYELVESNWPSIDDDCLGTGVGTTPNNYNDSLSEDIHVVDIDGDGIKEIFTSIGYNGCNRHKSAVMYRYNGQKYVQDSDSGFYLENWYHGWALMVFTSKDYDNDGDIDLFTRYFHNNGCNIMHHSNYESEESRTGYEKGFFWKNEDGILVQTTYEFCE